MQTVIVLRYLVEWDGFSNYAKWKGNGMENCREKYSSKSGMESEWKRNRTGKEKKIKFTGVNISWNGIDMEWKWNGTFTTKIIDAK